jgi:hypothetical protein
MMMQVYLEAQTELIVNSIQSLLTTIRGPGGSSSTMGATAEEMEGNLGKIISIVSAIVDRCSSPASSARPTDAKTRRILAELAENCDKLTQMQQAGLHPSPQPSSHEHPYQQQQQLGFSKHIKQAMAAASFGVAKALKEL